MNSIIKIASIITFFFISIFVTAQEKNTMLFGKVRNDSIYIENIMVVNLRTNFGTTSLQGGEYYIKAKLGDSILYKSITHKNRKIKITENHIEKKFIEVFLEPQINQLDTVTIAGSFSLDVSNIYIDKDMILDKDAYNYIEPTSVINSVDPNAGQAGIDMLGLLVRGADALFLKKKREEKKKQEEIDRKKNNFINNFVYKYEEIFFTQELKIHKHRIYQFIDFCEGKGLGNYYNKREIEIKNFLILQSRDFNKL